MKTDANGFASTILNAFRAVTRTTGRLLAAGVLTGGLTLATAVQADDVSLTGAVDGTESAPGADASCDSPSLRGQLWELITGPCCFCDTMPKSILTDTCLDQAYDCVQEWKKENCIPITVGAWNWWHVNNGGPAKSQYGYPGISGTYFYYIEADPEWEVCWGPFTKVGAHTQYRLRDGGDGFRSFYSTAFWFYELYAWGDTDFGRVKAGKIWKRFGLDWDGTFWGNVPYFDGFKLDPDWGIALENTPKFENGFKIDTFAQFFFHEDGVNGSIAGADPESVVGSNERNTGVVRVVPTWEFCDKSTLALGLSGLVGEVENETFVGDDEGTGAYAVDATYTRGNFKVFGELMQSFGRINPTRYVSGGPSNRITDALVGAHYTCGPVTYRLSYSAGFDDNPGGHQNLWVPGATVALTKNVDLYLEYVRWDVQGNAADDFIEFEDGFQIIINWRF